MVEEWVTKNHAHNHHSCLIVVAYTLPGQTENLIIIVSSKYLERQNVFIYTSYTFEGFFSAFED